MLSAEEPSRPMRSTSARLWSSVRQTSTAFRCAAQISGVQPLPSASFGSARQRSSQATSLAALPRPARRAAQSTGPPSSWWQGAAAVQAGACVTCALAMVALPAAPWAGDRPQPSRSEQRKRRPRCCRAVSSGERCEDDDCDAPPPSLHWTAPLPAQGMAVSTSSPPAAVEGQKAATAGSCGSSGGQSRPWATQLRTSWPKQAPKAREVAGRPAKACKGARARKSSRRCSSSAASRDASGCTAARSCSGSDPAGGLASAWTSRPSRPCASLPGSARRPSAHNARHLRFLCKSQAAINVDGNATSTASSMYLRCHREAHTIDPRGQCLRASRRGKGLPA
mmetsp:Transcript_53112/g.164548  ORF Transcript_53112/g.164548 Transcript_53112/m.164548 type:complete len:338 (-) Transcript_53112:57-1070(-)